jgi:hypothetical protein
MCWVLAPCAARATHALRASGFLSVLKAGISAGVFL